MPLTPGTRIGSCQIEAPIGAGGMGEVYRARDTRLLRAVAVKVLPSAVAADPERHTRFVREARLLASLNHQNIGAIYGIEDASGVMALVLELVEGPTLEERLAEGRPGVGEVLSIARQIVDALEAAHERGIVHRDLKPANIKLTPGGTVKVLDFGLAKALAIDMDEAAAAATLTGTATRAGVVMGSAPYMSPEQARGQAVDRRTDIWAFGCVLYEMLSGRRAFAGTTMSDAIVSVLERDPDFAALPPETPASLRRLLRWSLQKDARNRLRDIADARLEIQEALATATEPSAIGAGPAPRLRSVVAWFATGGVAVAVLLVGAWFLSGTAAGEPPALFRVSRFVSTAAHEFGPAISRDGKWVAYLSNARGPSDVWVKTLTGGEAVNLTASHSVFVSEQSYISGLEISPDGGLIAFSGGPPGRASGDASTWVIPAPLGGVPRRFLPPPFHGVRWSPDGARTAFIGAGGSRGDSIWVADADGQNGREILKAEGGLHAHWISWSRDGRWIYFNRQIQNFNTGPTEIYRVPSDGGPIEAVITTARRAGMAIADPDGRGLFYSANPDSVELGLWWRDLRSGKSYRLTSGIGEYTEPSLSADGRHLVATVLESRQNLARIRVDGQEPPRLEPITDGFTGDFDPVWSPDRTRLVFTSSRTGTQNLWWMPADVARVEPLTVGNALDVRPSFSPDGHQLAFVSDRGGHVGVWILPLADGTPRLLAPKVLLDGVGWSPDGRRLVAAVPGPARPQLVSIAVSDGTVTPIPTPDAASAPSWSPAEDLIAYLAPLGQTNGTRLRFVTGDGRPRPDLISPSEPSVFGNGIVAWSADGRRLAVAGLPGVSMGTIWIAELASPPTWKKLMEIPAGVHLRGMTWSLDGSTLTVGVMRTSGDIILAER